MRDVSNALPASAWRWGDYLLEPGRRRLTLAGEPVGVEDRVLDLVMLLLQHRERALDRQEVIAAIWGKRPVSDATLRQLVYKARRAVGDDGGHQTVISTLYGRSLQWIAPVEMVLDLGVDVAPSTPATTAASVPPQGTAGVMPGSTPTHRRMRWVIAALALLAIGSGAGWFFFNRLQRQPAAQSGRALPRLAIAPIVNATGDPALDWTSNGLPGLMSGLLAQAGGLDVVDPAEVARAWQFKRTGGRSQIQQLRFASNADGVVTGRLRRLSTGLYELDLHIEPFRGAASDLVVSGDQPGLMAASALGRLRERIGVAARVRSEGRFPDDPLLMQAFARATDLEAQGKERDAINYLKLCTAEAPGFLPCWSRLARAQASADDAPGSRKTLQQLLANATRQHDPAMAAQALVWMARHARAYSNVQDALALAREAVPYAERAQDYGTLAEAHLMSAISAHTLGQRALAAQALQQGADVVAAHPSRRAQALLADVRHSFALDDGDTATALQTAHASLALAEAVGDERNAVTGLTNIAITLQQAGRTVDAIAVQARAMQRAHAAGYDELEADNAAALAMSMLDSGLVDEAIRFARRFDEVAANEGSNTNRVLAAQILAAACLQIGDGNAALAWLRKADALLGADADPEVVVDERFYAALAAFIAEPGLLPAMHEGLRGYAAAHPIVPELANRLSFVDALSASAQGRAAAALASLRVAAAAKPLAADSDMERRVPALLVALHDRSADAAALALAGYDAAATRDASMLRWYARWKNQRGDGAAARRAVTRLAVCSERGALHC